MFSGAFCGAFVVPLGASGYVGPVSAQRMLLRGFPVEVGGDSGAHWVRVGSRKLIGPAGKVFSFRSLDSAAVWLSINAQLAAREKLISETMPEISRAFWYEKKRVQMVRIVGAVVNAAARCRDASIQGALIAESNFCAAKWG